MAFIVLMTAYKPRHSFSASASTGLDLKFDLHQAIIFIVIEKICLMKSFTPASMCLVILQSFDILHTRFFYYRNGASALTRLPSSHRVFPKELMH